MQVVAINGNVRTETGTSGSRRIRKSGMVPAVLYGSDEVLHFSVSPKEVRSLIYTPDFKLAELTLDGKTYKCFIKDSQFHPVTDELLHIDFLGLTADKPVKVEIPVGFKGESPGVKGGGNFIQQMRKVMIKTTPDHIVDTLMVDISDLELGSAVRVRDVEINEHMEMLSPLSTPVATVEVPRALKSAEAAAEAEEGAEGGEAEASEAEAE